MTVASDTKPEDFLPQKTVLEILNSKKRTLSAEIIPPRNGAETESILRQISALKTVPVDFISVTKGAGGSLRGGTLPIAQLVKSQFQICSLAHFTCRDYTVEEIENTLMDHHYFGVNNILALRGDPPDGQPDYFKPAPNRHTYAFQLVNQITKLNDGVYLSRQGFDDPSKAKKGVSTKFCIGVAAHPEHEPFEDAVQYLKHKVDAGAHYAITQMIFDAEPYAKFLAGCAKQGFQIPVLPGLRIVTQLATAERMIKKFGVKIPQTFLEKLATAKSKEDGKKIGLEFTYQLSRKMIEYGAPGIHVFVMSDETTATELLRSLK